MNTTLQARAASPPIPWHYQAAADRLVGRVLATDSQVSGLAKKFGTVIKERIERKGRHTPCRPETLVTLERQWRETLPAESRLGLVTDWERNRAGKPIGLTISDARVTAMPFNLNHWPIDHDESGLGILIIKLGIKPGDVRVKMDHLAVVTKHALGRRYQRGWPSTDEAVLEDLKRLANARMVQPEATVVPVDSGTWSGKLMWYEGKVILTILTFLPPT